MDTPLTGLLENGNSNSFLYSLITNLTVFYAARNLEFDKITRSNSLHAEEYDYVVVGAGSAGGIVASRLSEVENISVLLLEAGGDPLLVNEVPFFWLENVGHPETDWMFATVPQKYGAMAYPNNTIPQPRGKSLGGTSNLNAMAFWRGNPRDYDNWAKLTKDDQWSYDKLLPFFKKLESYDGSFAKDPEYHGEDGPIHVTRQTYQPLGKEWIAAGLELGFPYVDPDARQTSTFIPVEVSGLQGRRWEVYKAYLEHAQTRKNLDILRYAHVTKINLNSGNDEAESVTYIRHGETFTVNAKREIIISAGTYCTPQLLMLSGIGPPAHLASVGIETKVDLPGVGENYLDHVVSTIGPFLLNDSVSFVETRDLNYAAALEYITNGTGPFSWNLLEGNGLYSTSGVKDWPNIAYHHMPIGGNGCALLGPLKEGICEKYMVGVPPEQDGVWAIMFLGRDPKSRGTVRLRSNDHFDPPLIDPNVFSDRQDVKDMVEGFKFIINLYESTDAFKKYNCSLIQNKFPGCESFDLRSDEYYECYLQHVTRTMYHPSSTCKMGSNEDPMAVVDSNLRVRGVARLRIADASIMPEIPNVNINPASMMIGEKAADLILQDWQSFQPALHMTSYYYYFIMAIFSVLAAMIWALSKSFKITGASKFETQMMARWIKMPRQKEDCM